MEQQSIDQKVQQIVRANAAPAVEPSSGVKGGDKAVVIQGNNNVIQLTTSPPRKVVQGTPGYRVGLIIAAALAWGLLIGAALRDIY